MQFPWFKRHGIFFLPVGVAGWLILIATLTYTVYAFIDIDSRSHSASDTLMNFLFRLVIIATVYSLIAVVASSRRK